MKASRVLMVLLSVAAPAACAGRMVPIPPASYEEVDRVTGVKVSVTVDGFLISATEVTQKEFEEVTKANRSFHRGPEYPVENVSWWDAVRYCNLRSIGEGLQPCYDLLTGECDFSRNGYRLPTDAEWTQAYGRPTSIPPERIREIANIGTADTKSVPALLKTLQEHGTRKAGSYPPNEYGLYDMLGNVWEWCNDYFNPSNTPRPATDPAGAIGGVARIVRGGSFLSTTGSWAHGYRSSMDPAYKGRFTGFRVCRSLERQPKPAVKDEASWYEPYNRAPAGFEGATGGLSALLAAPNGPIATTAQWQERRQALREKWMKLLGAPSIPPPAPAVKLIETVHERNYTGELMYLQVEPDFWEKIYVLRPNGAKGPLPAVIVPYYDVDVPAGRNMGGRTFPGPGVTSFAYMAVQQGYIAVAVRWFGESYGEGYSEAVANLKLKYPECTGLGKWVWDARRLLDYIDTLPEVDHSRIGIIGHSLGAKMALYAAAMDDRISAAVFSEGGIGLSFSNYDDYWYFGDVIRQAGKATDQHELLGLIAPRPFLLIGGDKFDTAKSWYYVNAARSVYRLYGKPGNIGYFNHHSGHQPSPEAVWRSVEWLKHFLGPGSGDLPGRN